MPIEGQTLFKNRETITNELIAEFQAAVPDVHTGEDSVVRILCEVMATVIESTFLSAQIISEDMFVQTANLDALYRHGDEYGLPRKVGEKAIGAVKFSGTGGTVIPIGTEVGYDPQTGGELLYFNTTELKTLPSPGVPGAPVIADAGVAGSLVAGTYEYVITFTTANGETEAGAESLPLTLVASRKVNLSAIPLGGPGTVGRRIYRQRDATGFHYVAQIGDNTSTTYLDDIPENLGGAEPPEESTAEAIVVAAQAEDAGLNYNVLAATITVPTDVPDGITDVINPAAFIGGTDPEQPEDYRNRLLEAIRNPYTGSPEDLEQWAEQVSGVESATVFSNDNVGTPTSGHATVRIVGLAGTIPDSDVINAVYESLTARDIANITLHVATFTPTVTNVSVTLTLDTGYLLADVSPSVVAAISDYINLLAVGESYRVTGVIAAVIGLPGVLDVVVNSPSTNQATAATSKRVAGTITVA